MSNVKSTFCRICEPACPLLAQLDDTGEIASLSPNPDHPLGGIPCNKGISFLEHHNDPDRLNFPLQRRADKHEAPDFQRVSWDDAMNGIATKIKALQQQYGNDAVAVYVGNPPAFDIRAMLVSYGLNEALGSKSYFSAGTQDCSNKSLVSSAMYGSNSFFIPDLKQTDYLLCIGANPKASHWTFFGVPNDSGQILKDIKARDGTVRFLNPRKTESSTEQTGETLLIKPDTDVYFLTALSHEIHQLGGFDEEQLARYGKHVDSYKAFIADWPAEKVAAVTGIDAATIKQVASEMVAAKSAACYMSTGVNQGRQGSLGYWLNEMLNFATGNLGKEGGAYKGTGLMPPSSLQAQDAEWDSPDGALSLGVLSLPCTLLPDAIEQGKVRALICLSGNPLLSMSGEARVKEAFEKLDLMVCVDLSPTATTQLADYVLPAADWLEREDISAFTLNLGVQLIPSVQYTEAVVEPAAERRTDWWIVSRLMQAMDLPSPLDEAEHRDGFKAIDMLLAAHELSIDKLKSLPHQTAFLAQAPKNELFQTCLLHEDKKIDCYPDAFVDGGLFERFDSIWSQLSQEPKNTLKIISMRNPHMHNSWMSNVAVLRTGNRAENRLRMCTQDAESRDLFDGDSIRVFNEYGDLHCRLEVRDDVRPGAVAMSHGFGHAGATDLKVASAKPGANYNRLLPTGSRTYEPLSYMSWMNGVPVQVERTA